MSESPVSLLSVRQLNKSYSRGGIFRRALLVSAVRQVSFELSAGENAVLVGESGSGKSTLARCVAALEAPDSGEVIFAGADLTKLAGRKWREMRRRVQLVFQATEGAFNARFTVGDALEEPLLIQGAPKRERHERAAVALADVGLPLSVMDKNVLALSGGQRQRLALARALVLEPELLILDEVLSGLDISIQAQIVNLVLDLQVTRRLTCFWITHDMDIAQEFADTLLVMKDGELVEHGPVRTVVAAPRHPYTASLLAARRGLKAAGAPA